MELTPQTLHAVEFREARRGGYNTRDVDDFLERVAAGVGLLQDRLRDAMARAESAEGRLGDMQRQLEEVQRRPVAPPAPAASETDDTLRRTLVLAQRTADATIKEAKDEAARLLSEAREEAARTRSEVEAEARRGTEGARQAAEAEIEHLIDTRDALKGDLEALTHQIERQRDQLRAGIAELERVLDDPSAFQAVGTPQLTEVERPPSRARLEAPAGLPSRGAAPAPGGPGPSPAVAPPALPMRNAQPELEVANGANGTPDHASPFQLGAQVAALQEAPPLPSRPKADAPAQPAPFVSFSGGGGGGAGAAAAEPAPAVSPWPSELRTSVGPDEAPPAPGGQQPANGAVEGIGIEPGSRPSEWGKAVFEADDTDPRAHFGRRNG